jgi:small subunit ribosomal protein S1
LATKTVTKISKAGPSTMEELLAVTGYKLRGFKRGQTVKGKVKEVTGRTVYIDIGGKAEAVVADQEFNLAKDYFQALKPGDDISGVVLVSENDAGQVVLSLRQAAVDTKWKKFEEALAEDKVITVKGKEVTKGGLLVEEDGVYGFIPSSQFGREASDTASFVGKPIRVKVVEVDRQQNRLVLSEKAVSEAEEIEGRKLALAGVKLEGEYEGLVVGSVPFGAFVEISIPGKTKKEQAIKLEGLVHISEMSWEKVDEVGKVVKDGDKIKVVVIGIDEDNGKLALSIKRLSSDPWLVVAAKYKTDSKHKGEVAKVTPYGVLIRLERGIEGLIHASKMPVDRPFNVGDPVDVFVESVDLEKRRLSLGVVLTTKPVGYK